MRCAKLGVLHINQEGTISEMENVERKEGFMGANDMFMVTTLLSKQMRGSGEW